MLHRTAAADARVARLLSPNRSDRGVAALSSGQVYVNCPLATVSSIVFVTYNAVHGTPGILEVIPTAGQIRIVSITSAGAINTADTSAVFWMVR